jgi:hypothetical protein
MAEARKDLPMKRNDEYQTHPSYGNASFHRITGQAGKLYGSALPDHHATVRLTISRSSFKHDLGRDWHHASNELIEVEFSAAQFAELLTTMNVGQGTCCTIRRIREGSQYAQVPGPPQDLQLEHERVSEAFREETDELVDRMRQDLEKVDQLLAKKGALTVKEKEQVRNILHKGLRHAREDAPFLVDQFQEATQKTVTAAKAEVDASLTAVVQKLGFEQLQKQVLDTSALQPKELPETEECPRCKGEGCSACEGTYDVGVGRVPKKKD